MYRKSLSLLHNLFFNFAAQLQILENWKIGEKNEKMSRINASATMLLMTIFSSVYLVNDYIENLSEGKVTN